MKTSRSSRRLMREVLPNIQPMPGSCRRTAPLSAPSRCHDRCRREPPSARRARDTCDVACAGDLGRDVVDAASKVRLTRLREHVEQHEAVARDLWRHLEGDAGFDLLGRRRWAPACAAGAGVDHRAGARASGHADTVRLWIVAATLFRVTTRGREMTRPLPFCSRALKRRFERLRAVERAERQIERRTTAGRDVRGREVEQERHAAGARYRDHCRRNSRYPGKFTPVLVPVCGPTLASVAPLHAEIAR